MIIIGDVTEPVGTGLKVIVHNCNDENVMDWEERTEEVIHKLRKFKGFCPMIPEEADTVYDAAPADPISEEDIDSMIGTISTYRIQETNRKRYN